MTIFAFVVFAVSVCLQIFVSNRIAVKGNKMLTLLQKEAALEEGIAAIKLEGARYSSLIYIETSARRLGFLDLKDNVGVISSPVAVVTN